MRHIAIILNTKAGIASHTAEIEEYVASLPKEAYDVILIKDPTDISKTAGELALSKDVIVAAGGDGTVNAVAGAIIATQSDTELGVTPSGTLNHFAKDLGLPLTIPEALHIAVEGNAVKEIDAASCNGRVFINNSSIGVYAKAIKIKERYRERGIPKWLAFGMACVETARNIPKMHISVEIDGKIRNLPASMVFVGNNVYSPDSSLVERTSLEQGVLSLLIAKKTTLFGLIELTYHALLGKIESHKDFDSYIAKEITVETGRTKPMNVSLNGEIIKLQPPLVFKTLPKALKVKVQ